MRRVRCCAVGLRIDPARATSTSTFLAAVHDLLDREVEPHPDAPTLVAFPEHTGLVTMFVGPRGAVAREQLAAGASTLEALTSLAISYGEVLGHYAGRFPDVRSAGRLLHLACTDVMVRTVVDGFASVAADRGLWLTVGAALPDWELRRADELDDDVAATLLGAEPAHDDVYVATGSQVRNRNLVFSPDGELVAVHDKAYLVPLEADAEQGLGLSAAGLDEIAVAELPLGRLGTVISKDAWMPDVNERLGQLGAQLVVQPEAFDRWGLVDRGEVTDGGAATGGGGAAPGDDEVADADGVADLWPPDKFQRGGWWMVQRHPSFRVNVAPMLLGHLADLSFDGQALIAVPAPAGEPELGLLGQPYDAGWAAVGPWGGLEEGGLDEGGLDGGGLDEGGLDEGGLDEGGLDEGGIGEPASALADEQRRAGFEEHARRLAPGSGDPLEGTASEGVVWADVDLPDPLLALPDPRPTLPDPRPPTTTLPRPAEVPASVGVHAGGTQLVPDLASDGTRAWLAWIEVDGPTVQAVTIATGDGTAWRRPERVSPRPVDAAGGGDRVAEPTVSDRRWRPRLTVHDGRPSCVFLGFPNDNWELFASRNEDDWKVPVRVDDAHDDAGVLRERLHDAPVLDRIDDELLAVWSDVRWPWVFPQVRYAWSGDGGATWSASARIDGRTTEGQPDPLAPRSAEESRGQTTPAVAVADGAVLVAWQERDEHGAPAIHLARLTGRGPSPAQRLAGDPDPAQRVARPVLAAAGATLWLVWERWDAAGGAALVGRVSQDSGATWSEPRLVDPDRPVGVTQRHATLVPTGPTETCLVFEDDRAGTSAVAITRIPDRGDARPPVRVDDAPDGAHARAPTATLVDDHLVVAWQDTRDDAERIRTVRVVASTLA